MIILNKGEFRILSSSEFNSIQKKIQRLNHRLISAEMFYKNLVKQIEDKAEEQAFKDWAESLDFRYNHDLSVNCWSFNSESFNGETEEEWIEDCDWWYNELNRYALKNKPEHTHGWPENPTWYELYQMDNQFEKLYNMQKNYAELKIELFHVRYSWLCDHKEFKYEMHFGGETYDFGSYCSPKNDKDFTENTSLAILKCFKQLPKVSMLKVCLTEKSNFVMLTNNYWYKRVMTRAKDESIKVIFDNSFTFIDERTCPF
jgi:hypothetical protein